MGITVFDLFNEIITIDDMKRFLQIHDVKEDYFGAGLIIRAFLQMIDISPGFSNISEPVIVPEVPEDCPVKIEESDSYDEIEYSDQEIHSRLSELATDSEEEILPKMEDGETPRKVARTCKTKKCGCGEGKILE